MRKYPFLVVFITLFAMVLFCGCGNRPSGYGNFANAQSVEVVQDAVNILKATYPPAKTRLNLLHVYGDDVFGAALVETLRRDGYAIAEYVRPQHPDKYATAVTPKPDGLDFAYVADHLAGEEAMRLTLFVGTDTLNRMYSVSGRPEEPTYSPMGDWVRKQ